MKKYITRSYMGRKPSIPESCTVFENCALMGDVRLGENCVVMPNCVLRADYSPIIIGDNSNIQDLTCIHSEEGENGAVIIGKNVTVGHRAMLHGCKIRDNSLIGMNATVLNGAVIEEHCIIGASSLVTEGKVIPKGSVAYGNPAKIARKATEEDIKYIDESAEEYAKFAKYYNESEGEDY